MSDNTKHTPGPWIVLQETGKDEYGHNWFFVGPDQEPDGYFSPEDTIATVWDTEHDGEANARLIAAAPLLVDALKNLVREIPPCTCGIGFKSRDLIAPDCVRCWLADEIDAAEAALRAAGVEVELT